MVIRFIDNPEILEAVTQWEAARVHGTPTEVAGQVLIERLEYLLMQHEGWIIQVKDACEEWEHA